MKFEEENLVASFSDADFVTIKPFPHPTQMAIMPVIARKDPYLRAVGTCFAISSQGLVMTARHVVEEALGLDSNGRKTDPDQWISVVYCSEVQWQDEESVIFLEDHPDLLGGLLPVKQIYFNNSIDIALMQLNLPYHKESKQLLRMPQLSLGLKPPGIGEECVGMGYHKMDWKQELDNPYAYQVMQSYSATKGIIKKIYQIGRDRILLPFPCFEITCRFDGGMSGGPIISMKTGHVVGVVCNSLNTDDTDSEFYSHGSLIGSGLLISMDFEQPNKRIEKKFLYDFWKEGIITTDNVFTLVKDVCENGERILTINLFNGFWISNKYSLS